MLAYEFYLFDEAEFAHFVGILPERRKKQERINQESILNWAKMVIGDSSDVKDIIFVKVKFWSQKLNLISTSCNPTAGQKCSAFFSIFILLTYGAQDTFKVRSERHFYSVLKDGLRGVEGVTLARIYWVVRW